MENAEPIDISAMDKLYKTFMVVAHYCPMNSCVLARTMPQDQETIDAILFETCKGWLIVRNDNSATFSFFTEAGVSSPILVVTKLAISD